MNPLLLIYHEKQQEALCAVHCINNLLQGDYTNAGDLAQIAAQLDNAEEQMLLENGKHTSDYQEYLKRGKTNVSESGDFSIQVVTEYLKIYGIELSWLYEGNPETKKIFENPTSKSAYICNLNSHWLCLRAFNKTWFKLDSTQKQPEHVSPTYLSLYLNQLKYEGYSVFCVEGTLPPCKADYIQYDPKSTGYSQSSNFSNSDEDEIQKAIKLSLQDSTNEDEEIKKAIQLSIQEEETRKSKKNFIQDYKKYLTASNENSTKVQFRLPNGKKEIHKILLNAPLAVLYSIFNELLGKQEKNFTVIYQDRTVSRNLENTVDKTLLDENILNVSLSIVFD